MNNKANFSHWLEQQKHKDGKGGESSEYSMFGTIAGITDGFSAQMLELQGSLPDVNGLTGAAFRERMTYSIYLLLASVGCGILAVVVGLPTIALKPAKFVVFMSLSTLCSIGSVCCVYKETGDSTSLIMCRFFLQKRDQKCETPPFESQMEKPMGWHICVTPAEL